jgi:quinoprotein glucose dehydrogenase
MLALGCAHEPTDGSSVDWPVYGGETASRYSGLAQINTRNVADLKQVWRFDAGRGGLQTSPLVVGRTLYAYTTNQQVLALDATTGEARWTFDAKIPAGQPARGLTWWSDGKQRRLFAGVMNQLYALDPDTGQPIPSFGEGGKVDLRKDLGNDNTQNSTYLTSPGVIYQDLIIVGFRTGETKPAAPGHIRAYDVHTGKLRWIFHTIPYPGEPGYESWPAEAWKTAGAANNWAGMVVDAKRGIVYVPTGSAADDFYGADRKGDDLYANTLLALDAATGKLLWHFQGVHHDIWDRDFPSPPVLVTVTRGGKRIDAVAQTTKHGFVFVFDRVTGKPLFPIEERPFPASQIPGESSSPTQPIPLIPAPFARQRLTADMLTERTPEAHEFVAKAFAGMHSDGLFVPLDLDKPTVVFPGFDGGAEWGGAAADPGGVLYVNANDVPWTGSLTKNDPSKPISRGAGLYERICSTCHGSDRKGSPPQFPSLVGIGARMSEKEISDILATGRGRMPPFPLPDEYKKPVIDYLLSDGAPMAGAEREVQNPLGRASSADYRFTGYKRFIDLDGYPAVSPPWGTLNAIDLNSGRYLWKVPLGEYPELAAQGLHDTGSENYGGPIATAGGLVIIGATNFDRQIRAFDRRTGKLLWRADLPFAGNATPITYMIGGRQYVVIATSAARDRKGPRGSAYVAFALPER